MSARDTPTSRQALFEASLPGFSLVEAAVGRLAAGRVEQRGAVFTRREVVELILDLAGYASSRALHRRRLLEPCFGQEDFLLPALERLLTAYARHASSNQGDPVADLRHCVRAIELHSDSFESTRTKVLDSLREWGIGRKQSEVLASEWLAQGDFLLTPLAHGFHYVVGNPPYVRQGLIPDALLGGNYSPVCG